jgi:hypothetical protein
MRVAAEPAQSPQRLPERLNPSETIVAWYSNLLWRRNYPIDAKNPRK